MPIGRRSALQRPRNSHRHIRRWCSLARRRSQCRRAHGSRQADRGFEIVAHPHAEIGQICFIREFGQQGEMWCGRHRRPAGCTSAREDSGRSARTSAMNAAASLGATPAFCGSSPVLTWIEQLGRAPRPFAFVFQDLRQLRPVDRMDRIEQRRPPRAPCWSATDRSDAARYPGTRASGAPIWPAPPAPGSHRTGDGRLRAPGGYAPCRASC